jgi:serine protease Do
MGGELRGKSMSGPTSARWIWKTVVCQMSLCLALGGPVWAEVVTTTIESPRLKKIFAGGQPSNLDELRQMEQHQRQLCGKVLACTVGIVIGPSHGSGVIISEDGYVLTAAHVAGAPNRKATMILPDGREVAGESLGLYRTLDAGLMKISVAGPWPYAELAKSDEASVGQWCLATGHPGGFEAGRTPVVRIGRILLKDKFAITTDCTLVGGDSGGPLLDMEGRVIGINSRIGRFLTANMHVPVAAYHESWDRLVKGDAWGSLPGVGPYLGVQGEPGSKDAKISLAIPGSPAEKAGIQPGDVIVAIKGKSLTDFASLQSIVSECQPGEKVTIELLRGEERVKLDVEIGERER